MAVESDGPGPRKSDAFRPTDQALLAGETVLTRKDLAINGHEVMALFRYPWAGGRGGA